MTPADQSNGAVRRTEFRVIWQREGVTRRSVRFRSRAQAERKALILQGCMVEATGEDPNDYACCSGRECGCRGVTKAQAWAERADQVPPLVYGPVIQTREFTASPWREAASDEERA